MSITVADDETRIDRVFEEALAEGRKAREGLRLALALDEPAYGDEENLSGRIKADAVTAAARRLVRHLHEDEADLLRFLLEAVVSSEDGTLNVQGVMDLFQAAFRDCGPELLWAEAADLYLPGELLEEIEATFGKKAF